MIEYRKQEDIKIQNENKKRMWATIITSRILLQDQFLAKFTKMQHLYKIIASTKRLTKKLMKILRINLLRRGGSAEIRNIKKIDYILTFVSLSLKDNAEMTAKQHLKLFMIDAANQHRVLSSFLNFKKKGKIKLYIILLVMKIQSHLRYNT